MGIYSNDKVFGIVMFTFKNDYYNNSSIYEILNIPYKTLYQKEYDEMMNPDEMKEAYLFYAELKNKNNVFFKVLIECSNTFELGNKTHNMWHPISLDEFVEKFNV